MKNLVKSISNMVGAEPQDRKVLLLLKRTKDKVQVLGYAFKENKLRAVRYCHQNGLNGYLVERKVSQSYMGFLCKNHTRLTWNTES